MKTRNVIRAASAIALATVLSTAFVAPAAAQEATPWPEAFMKMADKNRDGMITRQEYLDHMAAMWDRKHAAMMKADTTMKAGMMNRSQFMAFGKAFLDPGLIGGG